MNPFFWISQTTRTRWARSQGLGTRILMENLVKNASNLIKKSFRTPAFFFPFCARPGVGWQVAYVFHDHPGQFSHTLKLLFSSEALNDKVIASYWCILRHCWHWCPCWKMLEYQTLRLNPLGGKGYVFFPGMCLLGSRAAKGSTMANSFFCPENKSNNARDN